MGRPCCPLHDACQRKCRERSSAWRQRKQRTLLERAERNRGDLCRGHRLALSAQGRQQHGDAKGSCADVRRFRLPLAYAGEQVGTLVA